MSNRVLSAAAKLPTAWSVRVSTPSWSKQTVAGDCAARKHQSGTGPLKLSGLQAPSGSTAESVSSGRRKPKFPGAHQPPPCPPARSWITRPLCAAALKPGGRHIIIVDTSQASVVLPAMALAVTSIASSLLPRNVRNAAPKVRPTVCAAMSTRTKRAWVGSAVTKAAVSVPSFGGRLVRKVSVVSALLRPLSPRPKVCRSTMTAAAAVALVMALLDRSSSPAAASATLSA
jgi:hypothetical protein